MPNITLPDGSVKKYNQVIAIADVAKDIGEGLARAALAGKIQKECFKYLDAPVEIIGSVDTPAIPLNSILEYELLTNANKVEVGIEKTLNF